MMSPAYDDQIIEHAAVLIAHLLIEALTAALSRTNMCDLSEHRARRVDKRFDAARDRALIAAFCEQLLDHGERGSFYLFSCHVSGHCVRFLGQRLSSNLISWRIAGMLSY